MPKVTGEHWNQHANTMRNFFHKGIHPQCWQPPISEKHTDSPRLENGKHIHHDEQES